MSVTNSVANSVLATNAPTQARGRFASRAGDFIEALTASGLRAKTAAKAPEHAPAKVAADADRISSQDAATPQAEIEAPDVPHAAQRSAAVVTQEKAKAADESQENAGQEPQGSGAEAENADTALLVMVVAAPLPKDQVDAQLSPPAEKIPAEGDPRPPQRREKPGMLQPESATAAARPGRVEAENDEKPRRQAAPADATAIGGGSAQAAANGGPQRNPGPANKSYAAASSAAATPSGGGPAGVATATGGMAQQASAAKGKASIRAGTTAATGASGARASGSGAATAAATVAAKTAVATPVAAPTPLSSAPEDMPSASAAPKIVAAAPQATPIPAVSEPVSPSATAAEAGAGRLRQPTDIAATAPVSAGQPQQMPAPPAVGQPQQIPAPPAVPGADSPETAQTASAQASAQPAQVQATVQPDASQPVEPQAPPIPAASASEVPAAPAAAPDVFRAQLTVAAANYTLAGGLGGVGRETVAPADAVRPPVVLQAVAQLQPVAAGVPAALPAAAVQPRAGRGAASATQVSEAPLGQAAAPAPAPEAQANAKAPVAAVAGVAVAMAAGSPQPKGASPLPAQTPSVQPGQADAATSRQKPVEIRVGDDAAAAPRAEPRAAANDQGQQRIAAGNVATAAAAATAGSPSSPASQIVAALSAAATPAAPAAAVAWRPQSLRLSSAETGRTLRIELHPAELGVVQARLTLANGQLGVELQAETPAARNRLSIDGDTIARSLRVLGFDVSQVTVSQSLIVQQPAQATAGASAPTQSQGGGPASADAGFSRGDGGARAGGGQPGRHDNGGNADGSRTASAVADRGGRGLYI